LTKNILKKIYDKKIETYFDFYNDKFSKLTYIDEKSKKKFIKTLNLFLNLKKKKKKILIFGNGGSAAMASHFSVDMTKIGQIRTVNFNESDLITCFANDYGYENWVSKAISFYFDKGDIVVLISSSGESQNMINAAKLVKKKKIKLITFTGFSSSNRLKKYGDLNFWVNSKIYNHVENIHQFWLLMLSDLAATKK
jgi:D-sedoheptulose 7-phosphate isomerase